MGGLFAKLKGGGSGGNASPKLVVIFGVTGRQGGSVAKAFLGDGGFKIRGITRNPGSEKAKALAETGIEIVVADQDDADSLKNALTGAYGVFAVTNYWEHMDSEREIKQGKNIADACKTNGVKHVVFSGVESIKELTGKECPFYDDKAIIEEYMKKEAGLTVTSVRFPFFFENFLSTNKPRKEDDDTYVIDIPVSDTPMDGAPASECGECIHQLFKQSKKYTGKVVGLSSFSGPPSAYAEVLTKNIEGKTFKAGEMTTDQLRELDTPGSEYIANMCDALQSGKIKRDVALTKTLDPKIPDFDTWVQNNKEQFIKILE